MKAQSIGAVLMFVAGASVIAAGAQARVSETSRVGVDGVGPIRIGMTVSQAARVAGLDLVPEHAPAGSDEMACRHVRARSGFPDVTFMVADARIARVDIKNPRIRTLSGARIGMTEAEVATIYAGRMEVTKHKYDPAGHYITVYPHRDRQVVFETNGSTVTTFRAGKVPEVGFVEGCS